MFLSETLELDCHSAEHGLVNYYNHALVGLSVRNRSQGERQIRGLRGISSHFRRPFTEVGNVRLRLHTGNVNQALIAMGSPARRVSIIVRVPAWEESTGLCRRRSRAARQQCHGYLIRCKVSPPFEAVGLVSRRD